MYTDSLVLLRETGKDTLMQLFATHSLITSVLYSSSITNRMKDVLKNLPPNSPNLSPIEKVWSMVQEVVNEQTPDKSSLIRCTRPNAWSRLPQKMIDKTVLSFDVRLNRIRGRDNGSLQKKQERSKPSLLEIEGDIKGKTEKLDEPRREAARLFFVAGKKFRPPTLCFVTAQNGRSVKGVG